MKNFLNIFTDIGLLIYAITTLIDRFVFKVPNDLHMILMIVAIIFIVIGFIQKKQKGIK